MNKSLVSAYQSLRKHDGNALVKRIRFGAYLLTIEAHKDRVAAVEELRDKYGAVTGVSGSSVSRMTTVFMKYCFEPNKTPEDVAADLLECRGHEAGLITLTRALDKAEQAGGGVAEAWELLKSGESLRSKKEKEADKEAGGEEGGEGSGGGVPSQPSDPALQEIIKAVIKARQAGAEDEQILMALDELATHAERHCGKEIVK